MNTKEILSILSGLIGFAVPTTFGIWLLNAGQAQSIASWAMWTALDLTTLILAIKAGNKKPWLPLGWTIAATFVLIAVIYTGGNWKFGAVEYLSAAGVIIAAYYWIKDKAGMGLWACAIAMFISGLPIAFDYWKNPQQETWWVWVGTVIACTLTISSASKISDIKQTLVPTSALIYNLMLLAILFR